MAQARVVVGISGSTRDTDDSILDVGSLVRSLQEHGSELAQVEILRLSSQHRSTCRTG
jgi:hypothetical protein